MVLIKGFNARKYPKAGAASSSQVIGRSSWQNQEIKGPSQEWGTATKAAPIESPHW
jgi:hypothetical protein